MSINATNGTKVYIGPTTAAASVTAYAALSYTEIKETENIGEFGDESETIKFTDLSAGRVRKLKGAKDAGDLTLVVAYDGKDTGQMAVLTAEASKFAYAFKVVVPDAQDSNDTDSTFYFHAYVVKKRLTTGAANQVTKRSFVLAIDTQIYEKPTVAVSGG